MRDHGAFLISNIEQGISNDEQYCRLCHRLRQMGQAGGSNCLVLRGAGCKYLVNCAAQHGKFFFYKTGDGFNCFLCLLRTKPGFFHEAIYQVVHIKKLKVE
jgi:hypothetical protein